MNMYIIVYFNIIEIIYFFICNMHIIKTQECQIIQIKKNQWKFFWRKFPQDRVTTVWDVPLTRDAPCAFCLQTDPHPPVSTSTALTLNMKTHTNAQKFSSGFRWTESWCVCVFRREIITRDYRSSLIGTLPP